MTKALGKFKTRLPEKSAFTIETEPDFPKLHTLAIASGKRGGGKSVAIANFIKTCKDKGYYDRVWLITHRISILLRTGRHQSRHS